MTTTLTRRGLLAAGAALAAAPLLPARVRAAADIHALAATTRTLDVRGRAVTVMGLLGPDGRPGLALDPGERFRADLRNDLAEPTIVHWHGQIPPNVQDGAPDMPMPLLAPGESRSFDFAARRAPTGCTATCLLAFGDRLSDAQIEAILAYIASTWPEDLRRAQEARE